jgi:hypothetical protein
MHNAVSILSPKRDRSSLHSFSIRDLLLVTVIVALAVGWWVDHWHSQARERILQGNVKTLKPYARQSLNVNRIAEVPDGRLTVQEISDGVRTVTIPTVPDSSGPVPNPLKE